MSLPVVLLLHRRVGQLLSVDDQVSVVRGLQGKASVADPTAVAFLLVLLHDVLQILFALCERQLGTQKWTDCYGLLCITLYSLAKYHGKAFILMF